MLKIKDNLRIVTHPFAHQELTKIRDKNTDRTNFRKSLINLGQICGYELMKAIDKKEIEVETLLGKCRGIEMPHNNIVLINVLRAASPVIEGLLKVFPAAKQGVISAKRIEGGEDSLKFNIEITYMRLPTINMNDTVIIADPMLATGSTLSHIINLIRKNSGAPKKIISLSIISAQYGIDKMTREFPDVEFITVATDPELNEKGYIVPGLGDAGDRAFE